MCCAGRAGLRGPRRDAASEGDATHPLLGSVRQFEWRRPGNWPKTCPKRGDETRLSAYEVQFCKHTSNRDAIITLYLDGHSSWPPIAHSKSLSGAGALEQTTLVGKFSRQLSRLEVPQPVPRSAHVRSGSMRLRGTGSQTGRVAARRGRIVWRSGRSLWRSPREDECAPGSRPPSSHATGHSRRLPASLVQGESAVAVAGRTNIRDGRTRPAFERTPLTCHSEREARVRFPRHPRQQLLAVRIGAPRGRPSAVSSDVRLDADRASCESQKWGLVQGGGRPRRLEDQSRPRELGGTRRSVHENGARWAGWPLPAQPGVPSPVARRALTELLIRGRQGQIPHGRDAELSAQPTPSHTPSSPIQSSPA